MVVSSTTAAEQQIRELVDGWVRAVRAHDLDGVMAHYAPDVVTFDVLEPLRNTGLDTARKRAKEWIDSFAGPIDYEMRELAISAGENLAFCHSVNHVKGKKADGASVQMWVRATVCFERIDGQWTVVHEHVSAPMDPRAMGAGRQRSSS